MSDVGGPGLTNPFAGPGIIRQEHLAVCGTEYQDQSGEIMAECACGTFAIGRCAECKHAVCGDHSALWGDRRLCDRHLSETRTADAARRQKADAQSVAESIEKRIRLWDDWLIAARRALTDSHDPIERLVRVVAALYVGSRPTDRKEESQVLPPLLLPDIFQDGRQARWWWAHDAVQAWFLRAVKVPPQDLAVTRLRTTIFGGTKREDTTAPGWSFPAGSTRSSGESPSTRFVFTVCVLADGRRLLGANADAGSGVGFNEHALAMMAEHAQLQPLPPVPPVSFNHPRTGERVWPT